MVSYELPWDWRGSAVLMTIMNASGTGTLSMIGIVQARSSRASGSFQVFAAGLSFAFAIICHRHGCRNQPPPFDMAEAESELTADITRNTAGCAGRVHVRNMRR